MGSGSGAVRGEGLPAWSIQAHPRQRWASPSQVDPPAVQGLVEQLPGEPLQGLAHVAARALVRWPGRPSPVRGAGAPARRLASPLAGEQAPSGAPDQVPALQGDPVGAVPSRAEGQRPLPPLEVACGRTGPTSLPRRAHRRASGRAARRTRAGAAPMLAVFWRNRTTARASCSSWVRCRAWPARAGSTLTIRCSPVVGWRCTRSPDRSIRSGGFHWERLPGGSSWGVVWRGP